MKSNVIIEPFRIKSIEPIRFTTEAERKEILKEAGYNLFLVKAEDVIIDLLTDSGTSAMSARQWAGVMEGDESYAGSRSFFRFEEAVKDITGMPYIIPTHQGRAAEKILFSVIGGAGKFIPNNTHFDTTRANIEYSGAEAQDLLHATGLNTEVVAPFKGNMDTELLERFIQDKGAANIPLCMITVTNNSGGGQPVSMANIREVKRICTHYGIPLFIDACRFAENAWFIKQREEGYADKTPKEIAQEMFSYADGVTMSAKKDSFANIGGFLAMKNDDWATQCRNLLIITEGFPTYGGLAGRDLEAIAIGLEEVLDEHYLRYRIRSTEYLHDKLSAAGVPLINPAGGHAVYLDGRRFLPDMPADQYPAQSVICALYEIGGVRAVEVGSVMFGKYDATGKLIPARLDLARLAIPRRVYTQSHIDYVADAVIEVYQNRHTLRGMKITYETQYLRHFTCRLAYV